MYDPSLLSNVADVCRVQARLHPDAVALSVDGQEIRFGELDARSNACAHALIASGVQPGDRVACLAKNRADFYVLFFGAMKARACLTPINWRLAAAELAFILKDSDAKLLVCGAEFAAVIDMVLAECADLHRLIQFEAGHPRWPSFDDWIGAYPTTDPNLAIIPQDDLAQLYTSGTTGQPKGVEITHANYLALFRSTIHPDIADFGPGDTLLVAMPMFHVAGINSVLIGLVQGCRTLFTREVAAAELIGLIVQQKVNHVFLAPPIINMMLHAPAIETADFSHLKRVFYGASPIAEDLLLRAAARFKAEFVQLYGLTETVGGGASLTAADHDPARGKLRACGRPMPGYAIRIATSDGQAAAPYEVGEIEIRSDAVMKGYWKRPEATREAIDPQGWFRTGDAGYFDTEGYLFIHDRMKDMIVSGGENIYPAEVENALFSHPDVADAAVIGVPDDQWGEAVKAVVTPRAGAQIDPAALIAHCRARIAGYKCPKTVDIVAALPRNPSGKVLRRELRAPYWAGRDRQVG